MGEKHVIGYVNDVAKNDPEFYRAFRNAVRGDEHAQARAVVEMSVLTIRSGDAWLPTYLALPAHVPDIEAEQRALLTAPAKADVAVRDDLIDWANRNRERRDRAAKALENLVLALRGADAILHDPDSTDEELMGWRDEIEAHVRRTFGVSIDDAPMPRDELVAWAWGAAGIGFPVAAWLLNNEQPRSAFTPSRGERRGGQHRPSFGGYTEQGED